MVKFGNEGFGQPFGPPDAKIMVTSNFRGDVMIIRQFDKVAWLDMSADVAVSLACALLQHAGKHPDLRLKA